MTFLWKKIEKSLTMAKKLKGGHIGIFKHPFCRQNSRKLNGEFFRKKFLKKVSQCRIVKGGPVLYVTRETFLVHFLGPARTIWRLLIILWNFFGYFRCIKKHWRKVMTKNCVKTANTLDKWFSRNKSSSKTWTNWQFARTHAFPVSTKNPGCFSSEVGEVANNFSFLLWGFSQLSTNMKPSQNFDTLHFNSRLSATQNLVISPNYYTPKILKI